MDNNARADALAFLTRHKVGVLATASPEGVPHASTVYYTVQGDFTVYFLTLINSRKYAALSGNPQAAFVVSDADTPQTLQMEGVVMDITLDEEAAKKKEDLWQVLNSNPWFYGPITKLDLSEVVVMWMRPTWVRWGDYAFAESGTDHVLKEIPLS